MIRSEFGATLPFSGQAVTTFALDETGMFFGAAFDGVGFLDLTAPTFLREPLPGQLFSIKPSLASISSPSPAQFSGASLSATDTYNVFFGAPPTSLQSLKASNVTFSVTELFEPNHTRSRQRRRGKRHIDAS